MNFISLELPDWSNAESYRTDRKRRIAAMHTLPDEDVLRVYGARCLGSLIRNPDVQRELKILVEAGSSPYDAVDAVTAAARQWIAAAALREIGADGRILDWGSGSGSLVNFGMDYSQVTNPIVAVDIAEPERPFPEHVRFVQSDLREYRHEGPPFDLGLSLHVFEHTPDPLAHISRMHDVLAKGARALIAVPNGRGLHDLLQHVWGAPNVDHINAFTFEGFCDLLQEGGFQVREHLTWPAEFQRMYGDCQVQGGRSLGEVLDRVAADFAHVHADTAFSCYGWLFVCEA